MLEVSKCVVCEGEIRRRQKARIAPFLAERIWRRPSFCVDLVQCSGCGFLFYNPRLEPAEEGRLYTGYRSEEYLRMRNASEPWYTASFNSDLAGATLYEHRRRIVGGILQEHTQGRRIGSILDYGGDRGDLVRGLVNGASAFVYDISGVEPAAGVTKIDDPRACKADLVINSNVLEHVGFPRKVMGDILSATPSGGLVFVEVPWESPFQPKRIARRLAQMAIVALSRPRLALSVVRPSTLYLMHEHVNYFAQRSLSSLMQTCGGSVIAAGSYSLTDRGARGEMAWCLGTVN